MNQAEPLSFSERRKKLLESRGETPATPTVPQAPKIPAEPEYKFDADLIPDIADERSEAEIEIDRTLAGIGILAAYQKWCGKEIDWSTRGRDDGFMVSCPTPGHRDSDPSAWINEKKGTWFCGGCQFGGDMYDIAAYHHNISDYKNGTNFHKLREAMAADFGLHVKRVANNEEIVWRDAPEEAVTLPINPPSAVPATPTHQEVGIPEQSPDAEAVQGLPDAGHTSVPTLPVQPGTAEVSVPSVASGVVADAVSTDGSGLASVTAIPVVPEDYAEPLEIIDYPTLDWRAIVKPDTFLWEYMVACCVDDSPEEYHFWNGMLALGHAVGRNVVLRDSPNVVPNLLLCMLGGTGIGKSKSRRYLTTLLHEVLPFDASGPIATGVKSVSVPGSGEFLVRQFTHSYVDPSFPKGTLPQHSPVNGIVDFDEFAAMLGRANRQGSSLKTIIMAMADASSSVKVGSLTHGEFKAENPFCSITASTQPRAIRTLVNKADAGSGFLNRWLFVSGAEKEKVVFGTAQVDLSRAVDQYIQIRAWGAIERKIEVSHNAMPHIVDYFKGTIYPARKNDETDLLARTDLIIKKMLLLLTINNKELEVTQDTFERVKPIYDYLVRCYALIHKEIGITVVHEIGEDITRALDSHFAKHGKGATPRDLQRLLQSKKYTAQQIKQTLDNLVALDWVDVIKPSGVTVGRPTVRYSLVKVGS